MRHSSPTRSLAKWFYRSERRLILAWVLFLIVGVVAIAFPPIRDRIFWRIEGLVESREKSWIAAVDEGERLVTEGRLEEAEHFLLNLDRRFPARTVRGALDRDRERLLRTLGRVYEGQGRSGRALVAYRALEAFDPRNYRNRWELAAALERLEGTWTFPIEARDAYSSVLQIYPTHLPSLRSVIRYDFDRGAFANAIVSWERSLRAQQYLPLILAVGSVEQIKVVVVDGAWHDIDAGMLRAEAEAFTLSTAGFPTDVRDVRIDRPLYAGTPGGRRTRRGADGLLSSGVGDSSSLLSIPLPEGVSELNRLRLQVRIRRPVDAETWSMVQTSYRNALNDQGLEWSKTRVVVVPDSAQADQVEVPA